MYGRCGCCDVDADSDARSHGDIVFHAVQLFAVGGAVGFFDGEGLDAAHVVAEFRFQLFDAIGERDERVGERVFDVVGSVMSTRWPLR